MGKPKKPRWRPRMEQFKALQRRKVTLVLEGGEGTSATLTLTGLSMADLSKIMEYREAHPNTESDVAAAAEEAFFLIWLAALPEHPDLTREVLRENVTLDMFPAIRDAADQLAPQGKEQGALECPACKHRFPFERIGNSVRVREDVANYPGTQPSPTSSESPAGL